MSIFEMKEKEEIKEENDEKEDTKITYNYFVDVTKINKKGSPKLFK